MNIHITGNRNGNLGILCIFNAKKKKRLRDT